MTIQALTAANTTDVNSWMIWAGISHTLGQTIAWRIIPVSK